MKQINISRLRDIAEIEFAGIVVDTIVPGLNELRIIFTDGSFLDVWFSLKLEGRYSYHWERRAIDGTIYRHDNAPHKRWQVVNTFPHHFHDGSEDEVSESYLSDAPEDALREFLAFVQMRLNDKLG